MNEKKLLKEIYNELTEWVDEIVDCEDELSDIGFGYLQGYRDILKIFEKHGYKLGDKK